MELLLEEVGVLEARHQDRDVAGTERLPVVRRAACQQPRDVVGQVGGDPGAEHVDRHGVLAVRVWPVAGTTRTRSGAGRAPVEPAALVVGLDGCTVMAGSPSSAARVSTCRASTSGASLRQLVVSV